MSRPVRVMTVDDQPVFRAVAHELVEATGGFDPVIEATSAERLRPELVLMDVQMPGMSGIETARRLMASDASTVVVLVTSGECSDVSSAARTCGAVALVAKQNLNAAVLRGIWTIHGPVWRRAASH